jgi:hypothetical protein
MAQLTLPIVARELKVEVRINLAAPDLVLLQAANQPTPQSVTAIATLDTGSNVTCVSAAIIRQLALSRTTSSKTSGIGGPVSVQLFHASLMIVDPAQPQVPFFVQPDLEVMELPPGAPVDVLIGMDVLLNCRLLIDGPNRTFTIDF